MSEDLFYYVSVVDGERRRALAGPYATHAAALGDVERVRRLAQADDQWAWFYGFGTCSSPTPLAVRYSAQSDEVAQKSPRNTEVKGCFKKVCFEC